MLDWQQCQEKGKDRPSSVGRRHEQTSDQVCNKL